jgi:hypothetical protein
MLRDILLFSYGGGAVLYIDSAPLDGISMTGGLAFAL